MSLPDYHILRHKALTENQKSPGLTTCVIGGAGFIGRAVVNCLLRHQRRVIVVGRAATAVDLPVGVDYVSCPSKDRDTILHDVLSRVDEIIDLAYATVPKTSFQDPVTDILVNLPEAVRLFEFAASLPIRKFVWISSGGTVYGRATTPVINENHPTLPLSPYGITKLSIEKYAHMHFEIMGLPIVCVRPSNAFGEGQRPYLGQGFVATAMASVVRGKEVDLYGKQGTVRDYLHVADVADGIVAALLDGVPGETYNIGSGIGLTNRQVLHALVPLAAQAKLPIKINVLPSRPFDVPTNVLDSSKLRAVSAWQPKLTFEEALSRTWDWHSKQAYS